MQRCGRPIACMQLAGPGIRMAPAKACCPAAEQPGYIFVGCAPTADVDKKLGGWPLLGINETLWLEVRRADLRAGGFLQHCLLPGPAPATCRHERRLAQRPPAQHLAALRTCPAQTFLDRRRYVLSVTDEVWAASIPRVEVYRWLL